MHGFYGKILKIDLSEKKYSIEPVQDDILEKYLGGKGLASYLLYELNPPGVDPLDPANCLIFATGLVTGNAIWGSCRYGVFTKSPQTGFYSESYDSTCGAYSMLYYAANDDEYRHLLLGSRDGYIRQFSDSTKNDVTTSSTSAIDSYITLPVLKSENDDHAILLNSITVTNAGGASGGSASDSDGVDLEIFTADDVETVIENIQDGDTPLHDITLSGTGRKNRVRRRTRGHSIALRFHNDTAGETWAIEKVAGEMTEKGRIK